MDETDSEKYNPIQDWSDRQCYIDKRGYRRVWVPEHPKSFKGGYYYEHRLVAERMAGRMLSKDCTVHHISRDKTDNRERNLFICYEKEHLRATKVEQGMAFA